MNTSNEKANDRVFVPVIIGISLVVPVLVGLMFLFPQTDWNILENPYILPKVNAILNGSTAVFLLLGLLTVKQKRIGLHRIFMVSAFTLSSLFLVCYVIYHSSTEPTRFGGDGVLKIVYLIVLFTHITLAALVLPFILFTFYRALAGQFERHRKLARRTWPVWFYVAVSGVLVYLMLSPYYPEL